MSKVQTLRAFVKQRLSAAAEEIFDVFERTIAEYEEELCRQHKLLEAVYKPEVRLHRAVSTDVQQLLISREEVPPEQQERSPSLDQEDPPEPPHIKEEQEELWSSQEGEQLPGLEEADIIKFTFTPVPVKSEEDDGEEPLSSQLLQSDTEENRNVENYKAEDDEEDCGGSEHTRIFYPGCHLQSNTYGTTSDSSEAETEVSCDWEETWEPQSGLVCDTGKTSVSSSECATSFGPKKHLQKQGIQTGKKQFSCSVCGKVFGRSGHLRQHLTVHTGEKRFSCSVCGMKFAQKVTLSLHLRIHTGEKPFSCSICNKRFTQSASLRQHATVHSGEKSFSCSVCGKGFKQSAHLKQHSSVHTGEKPFSCNLCDKKFGRKTNLKRHLTLHKPTA